VGTNDQSPRELQLDEYKKWTQTIIKEQSTWIKEQEIKIFEIEGKVGVSVSDVER